MNKPKFNQVILVGPTGRKRDSLQAILESLDESISIQNADTCQQAEKLIDINLSTLVLMDYRYPEDKINREINTLTQNKPGIHILLLGSQMTPKINFTNLVMGEVSYDDISNDVLRHLFCCFETVDLPGATGGTGGSPDQPHHPIVGR